MAKKKKIYPSYLKQKSKRERKRGPTVINFISAFKKRKNIFLSASNWRVAAQKDRLRGIKMHVIKTREAPIRVLNINKVVCPTVV